MAATQPAAIVRRADATSEAATAPQKAADTPFDRRVVRVVCIAIPLFVAFWAGLVALAVAISGVGYAAPLAMGAGVGALAGVFWSAWYAFVSFSHREEAERRGRR
jgi:fatty acid desaturase